VKDVRVTAAKIVEKDTLLVPGEPRDLGVTPLAGIALEPGSWLCTLTPADPALAPVKLPVRIERAVEWSQDVRLLPAKRVPDGFVAIPGGPFIHSGPEGGGGPEEARTCADFLIATFPVTSAEYLESLNDRATREPVESVAKRAPRDSVASVWPVENGRFRLPALIPGTTMKWDPQLPVFAISWSDALHYCAWRSARDGRFYTVPHEVQFEKAARGVDGRVFPFGNVYDGTFANTNSSFADGFRLLPVGAMPADVSPYGVRDLAGNMGTWCLNSIAGPFASVREYKGGAWSDVWHHARSPSRMGAPPAAPSRHVGIRLVMPVFAYV
jgi:serine/threonine-protein kinase